MKKALLSCIIAAVLVCSLCIAVLGEDTPPLLSDGAGLLSASEAESLSLRLEELSREYGISIVIVTVDSTKDSSPQEYADDFFDYGGYGDDGILLLISMEYSDWHVSTKGYGISVITDAGLDYMKEGFIDELSAGEYYGAFTSFADLCEDFIIRANSGDPYDSHNIRYPFRFFKNLLISVAVGFVISFIVTLIMKGKLKTVHFNDSATVYIKEGSMKVTSSRDTYLYSHVTKIPKPTDSGKGSSTHTSSSGSIHGGGGGKF